MVNKSVITKTYSSEDELVSDLVEYVKRCSDNLYEVYRLPYTNELNKLGRRLVRRCEEAHMRWSGDKEQLKRVCWEYMTEFDGQFWAICTAYYNDKSEETGKYTFNALVFSLSPTYINYRSIVAEIMYSER